MKALAAGMKDQLGTHDRDRDRFGLKLTANGWGYPVELRCDDYDGYKRGYNDS